MFKFLLSKISGSQSERILRRFQPIVDSINAREEAIASFSDEALRGKTEEFRKHIHGKAQEFRNGFDALDRELREMVDPKEKHKVRIKIRDLNNKVLEDVLVEAFAVVREAAKRTIGLCHHDVQLLGGLTLHYGIIAEMANGEGKTLVATLPIYLNALSSKGTHVVTVNDYLAQRDRYWMGPVYEFLGLSVGVIQHDMRDKERQEAYGCDVTYGTNNEFGFDYLRDNMKFRKEDMVQRDFNFAIVDEVDSILIDEARTPLIISGPAEGSTDKYAKAYKVAHQLKGRKITDKEEIDAKYKEIDLTKGFDFIVKEKEHLVYLTDEGEKKAAQLWGVAELNTIETMPLKHLTQQSLRAHNLFNRDVAYVVENAQVVIIDEFTGRLMPGRRWSDGLHQAVEAKEGVKIENENQTLATITFQNYFRLYEKLSGMSGTVATEAQEFYHIYSLEVVTIPTNSPIIRDDQPDAIYKTEREKLKALCKEVEEQHKKGLPVLVGTTSVEKNQQLSEILSKRGIEHKVLNARQRDHATEAEIIAMAGREGRVTVATNMAGRGTDIALGGSPKLKDAILTNIICKDSVEIISDIISAFRQPEDKFNEFMINLSKAAELHKRAYHVLVEKDIDIIKDSVIDLDLDFTSLYQNSLDDIARLEKIIGQEQKYLEEIFSIIGIDDDTLKKIDKVLDESRVRVSDLGGHCSRAREELKGFVGFFVKEKEQLNSIVESIIAKEREACAEIALASGAPKEEIDKVRGEQKTQDKDDKDKKIEAISSIELDKLSTRLQEIEKRIVEVNGDFASDEEVFGKLTKETEEFWQLMGKVKKLGRDHFDSRGISLDAIREKVLGKWRPIAYVRELAQVKQKLDVLKSALENELQNEIASIGREMGRKSVVEAIRRFQSEFAAIQEDLRHVNIASKDEIVSRDLSGIGDLSSLSEESRKKIGILSEDLEVYVKEHEKIVVLGGLQVLGTERHESRRIDNQLRGRSGRHGAPGASRFFLSLEDDLMRIFASDKIAKIMDFLKWEESMPIEHPLISKSIETAQKRVEQHNFDIRKQLLEYDNVMNIQREAIYDERRLVLESTDLKEHILEMMEEAADSLIALHVNENAHRDTWDLKGLSAYLRSKFLLQIDNIQSLSSIDEIKDVVIKKVHAAYEKKEAEFGAENLRRFTQILLLQVIDAKWKDHLYSMDHLREGIGLRGYAGHQPLVEYQREGYDMFRQMTAAIKAETLEVLLRTQPVRQERASSVFSQTPQKLLHPESKSIQDAPQRPTPKALPVAPKSEKQPFQRESRKVGRNEPCPCGSGKKYKKCCARKNE